MTKTATAKKTHRAAAASGKAQRQDDDASARYKKLLESLDDKKPLPSAAEADTISRPHDLDLSSLDCLSNNCVANHVISAAWSQLPMIRFSRKVKVGTTYKNRRLLRTLYKDEIFFNDQMYKRLLLENGMKLAFFVDNVEAPKYLVIQNVVREYEAPAHIHKLGCFILRATGGGTEHVCKPSTVANHGFVGRSSYRTAPVAMLDHFPQLHNCQMRMWHMEGEPNILIGFFKDAELVPTELKDKLLVRNLGLLGTERRSYKFDIFARQLEGARSMSPVSS